mmetsp:Transcript_97339/g.172339  ORF Transcript_97339/g.172339 Transcript_97339/m.172339 type:complete len:342 (+) Transcript_97339:75-1100(+)
MAVRGPTSATPTVAPEMAKEKASERLKGISMFNAFDLDGTGQIDELVLTRSLKIYDPVVFTDDVLEALVGAVNSKGRRIYLQALSDWLGYAPPPAPPARSYETTEVTSDQCTFVSAGSSKAIPRQMSKAMVEPLNAYVDSLVSNIKGFKDVIDADAIVADSGDSPEDLDKLKAELKAKAKEYVLDAQRKNIRPLWEEFDADGNGVLDPGECGKLVGAYLRSYVDKSSEILWGSIEMGVELSMVLAAKKVSDPAAKERMQEEAKKQVESIHSKVAPLVKEMLEKMAAEDPKTVADELLTTLDLNKDGKVTREEFEERFVESMQYVLGPERLMDRLHQVNQVS